MFWFNRHRRLRDQLSAYTDGQLTAAETEALERHLAACVDCRQALEDIRATVLALRDLSSVEVPRSFALRPEQVARPARPRPALAVPVLATGMRLAGAALVFALATVLVVDLGDLRGDSGGSAASQAAPAGLEASPEARMEAPPEESERMGVTAAADDPATEALAEMTPDAAPLPAPGQEEGEAAPELPMPAANGPAAAIGSDSGLDPLRVAEVAIAAALALLVVGSLTLAYARRKV